jgi:benzodiazapine receptor
MTATPRRLIDKTLNSEGRSLRHVGLGLAVTVGTAVLVSADACRAARPTQAPLPSGARATTEKPRTVFSAVLPALLSATTLSSMRVWNAPRGPARSGALAFWGLAQVVNGVWLAVRPRSMPVQMLAAMTSAGVTAAYAHEARKLDHHAGVIAAPQGRGVGVMNMVTDRLRWRPSRTVTLH